MKVNFRLDTCGLSTSFLTDMADYCKFYFGHRSSLTPLSAFTAANWDESLTLLPGLPKKMWLIYRFVASSFPASIQQFSCLQNWTRDHCHSKRQWVWTNQVERTRNFPRHGHDCFHIFWGKSVNWVIFFWSTLKVSCQKPNHTPLKPQSKCPRFQM